MSLRLLEKGFKPINKRKKGQQMKILHTSDWHIGKLVHGLHMTDDQRVLLKQLIELIKEEAVDVLLISGDIYDRSIPPTDAVELLDDVLSEIVMTHKIKVIAVAGNHDSPDRLDFGSKILRDNGLYISGRLDKIIKPIQLEDAYGVVNFYPIPYAEPAIVRALYEDKECKTHDLSIKKIMEGINEDFVATERNVCLSHAFVIGTETLETSDSERPLSIGGSEFVGVDKYEQFDYVALGHLHRPQKVKQEHIRYAGSLLKYSFSEAAQKKSVTLIELKEKGECVIEQKYLEPIRDMRIIKGDLEDLLKEEVYSLANTEDYISAVLTDEGKLFEPMKKLRSVYPNVLQIERVVTEVKASGTLISSKEMKTKKPGELFSDFYKSVIGSETNEEEIEIFNTIYQVIQKEERNK